MLFCWNLTIAFVSYVHESLYDDGVNDGVFILHIFAYFDYINAKNASYISTYGSMVYFITRCFTPHDVKQS